MSKHIHYPFNAHILIACCRQCLDDLKLDRCWHYYQKIIDLAKFHYISGEVISMVVILMIAILIPKVLAKKQKMKKNRPAAI